MLERLELVKVAAAQPTVVTRRHRLAPLPAIRYSGQPASAGVEIPNMTMWTLFGMVGAVLIAPGFERLRVQRR